MQKQEETEFGAKPNEEQMENLTQEERQEVEIVGASVEEEKRPPKLGKMKVDLHCHSEASPDCSTPFELILPRLREEGIRVQAITDHNLIWGAQKLQEMASQNGNDLTIIVGEEISTSEGEIIGLFLDRPIEPGLSPEETIKQIKAQSGLVLLPHGFDPLKRFRLRPQAVGEIADQIDIVETFNARVSRPKWNQAAVDWSEKHEALMSAGSDAHTLRDLGSAWVEVPAQPIRGPEDLLDALEGGTPVGNWTHPILAFIYKGYTRILRKLRFW